MFKKLGVDVTVSSTEIILEHIEEEVPTHPLTHLLTLREQGLEIVEVRIPPGSATAGKAVKELSLAEESRLVLVLSKGKSPRIPTANTILQAGDQVIALTSPESEAGLRAALTGI